MDMTAAATAFNGELAQLSQLYLDPRPVRTVHVQSIKTNSPATVHLDGIGDQKISAVKAAFRRTINQYSREANIEGRKLEDADDATSRSVTSMAVSSGRRAIVLRWQGQELADHATLSSCS